MAFGDGHALIIGIGTYEKIPWANVPITAVDARKVRDTIQDPNLCGYPAGQVTCLHDAASTKEKILAEFDNLASNSNNKNTVLIYYCGHGEYGSDGDYYLTTHDTEAKKGKVVPGTGISEVELLDKLRAINAKKLILITNACHSGDISPNLGIGEDEGFAGDVNLPAKTSNAILSSGEGRLIITACRPEQKSWIGKGELTIFTQALVEGLSGEGDNNNGYVSAFDLYEYIYYEVKENVEDIGLTQEPELTLLRGVGPFPVALYRGATSLGSFSEEPVPEKTAVREVKKSKSKRIYKKYVIKIKNMTGGFVQQGFEVQGNLNQRSGSSTQETE